MMIIAHCNRSLKSRFVQAGIILVIFMVMVGCAVRWWPMGAEPDKQATTPVPSVPSSTRDEPRREVETPTPDALVSWEPHPTSTLPLKMLAYPHFMIGYDEAKKNPAWITYRLAGPITHHGPEKRPSTFVTDFQTAAHVSHSDYSHSGFDRGHLCPAYAIFSRFGDHGLKETFIMSNVIPQYHGLNAGEWEQLETMIAGRDGHGDGWAATYGAVWVINGPMYDQRPAQNKFRNGTWIPSHCFSVVLRSHDGKWDALAFKMPNEKVVAGPVSRYLTTIAVIHHDTQIDILSGLSPAEKITLEALRATNVWR